LFICSSPPKDPSHWFFQLRKSKALNYKSVDFDKICLNCQKLPPEEMTKCKHVKFKSSLLKDNSSRKELNGLNINLADLIKENYGILIQEDNCIFKEYHVNNFMDEKNRATGSDSTNKYIMHIDPAYGGSNDTAIVCLTQIDGVYTIVLVDYKNTLRELYEFIKDSIHNFHTKVRKDHRNPLAISIESNARMDGVTLEKMIDPLGLSNKAFMNVHVIRDNVYVKKRKNYEDSMSGTTLYAKRKEEQIYNIRSLIETDNIKIHKNVETTHKDGITQVLRELNNQLLRFKHIDRGVSLKLHGNLVEKPASSRYSGKSTLQNDDIILALMGALYFWIKFWYTDEYKFQRDKLKNKFIV